MKDYRYYKVCRHYCKFLLKIYSVDHSYTQRVRDVHEFILQIYALEVNRSAKFWDPYLKFEMGIIAEMQAEGAKEDDISR